MLDEMAKDVRLQVRLTADEHAAWFAAAEAEQMSLSNWIRRRCNGLPTTAPVVAPKPAKKAKRT